MKYSYLVATILLTLFISGCAVNEKKSVSNEPSKQSEFEGFHVKFKEYDNIRKIDRFHELFVRGDQVRLDFDEGKTKRKLFTDSSDFHTACVDNKGDGRWLCFGMKEKISVIPGTLTANKDTPFTSKMKLLDLDAPCLDEIIIHKDLKVTECFHPEKYFVIYHKKVYATEYYESIGMKPAEDVWFPIEIETTAPDKSVFSPPA